MLIRHICLNFILLSSFLIQTSESNALPYKFVFFILPSFNAKFSSTSDRSSLHTKCKSDKAYASYSGTFQQTTDQDNLPGENLLLTDENCYLDLGNNLNLLKLKPGDKVLNLNVSQNGKFDTAQTEIKSTKLATESDSNSESIHWNRAIIIANGAMNLTQAINVMNTSARFYHTMSRSKMTMDSDIYNIQAETSCSLYSMYLNFKTAAIAENIDLDPYDKVTLIVNIECPWGGVAYLGWFLSAIQSRTEHTSTAIELHESGHLLGGLHSNYLDKEYADTNDPLGAGFNLVGFNSAHLTQFGFTVNGEVHTLSLEPGLVYELFNLDAKDSNKGKLQILKFSTHGENYFISFRKRTDDEFSQELFTNNIVEVHTQKDSSEATVLQLHLKEGDKFTVDTDLGIDLVVLNLCKESAVVGFSSFDGDVDSEELDCSKASKISPHILMPGVFILFFNYFINIYN